MRPLEIPPEAWSISYDESYEREGLSLYAIGSGANFTARAVARIGQLILNQGRWNNRQILSQEAIQTLTTVGLDLPEDRQRAGAPGTPGVVAERRAFFPIPPM